MIYLIYVVYRVNLEQISALGAASIPYGGTTQVWGSARAILDASATLLLVEVRGIRAQSKTVRQFSGSYEQARACGQCSATLPMFESFGVFSRQNNRYPLALVDFRSKTSLVTYLARSLYRLGSTARCPPASPSRMAVLREK